MGVLKAISMDEFEISLTEQELVYKLAVIDNEGPLAIWELSKDIGTLENALDAFDIIYKTVSDFLEQKDSMSIAALTNILPSNTTRH